MWGSKTRGAPLYLTCYSGFAIWGDQSVNCLNQSPKRPPGNRFFHRLLAGCIQHQSFCRISANLQCCKLCRNLRNSTIWRYDSATCLSYIHAGELMLTYCQLHCLLGWVTRSLLLRFWPRNITKRTIFYQNVYLPITFIVSCLNGSQQAHQNMLCTIRLWHQILHPKFCISPRMSAWKSELFPC